MALVEPEEALEEALALVKQEVERAQFLFPTFSSAHEGYAILLEEVEELWEEVKFNKSPLRSTRLRDEAVQVAAMAIRFILDITD